MNERVFFQKLFSLRTDLTNIGDGLSEQLREVISELGHGILREALSPMERLQGKYHLLIQRVEGGQRVHGCHPGLWRWSAG